MTPGVALVVTAVLAQAAAVPGGVTLKASAGLDGVCKPWRWTPVRVEITAGDEDIDGAVRVQWGDARVTRNVEIPAPSRRVVELEIRTGDPRATIQVALEAHGRDLQVLDVPVRLAGMDDPTIVCVHHSAAAVDGGCSVAVADDALPVSWRGYDAATDVQVASGAALTADQRRALDTWRARRRLEDSGAVTRAGGAVPAGRGVTTRAENVLALYILVMAIAPLLWSWRRSGIRTRSAALVGLVVSAAAATASIGRFSPAVVRHASVAEQFEYAPGALVSMRAVAEFPTRRRFSVSAAVDGAFDERRGPAGADEERFDAAGRPLLETDAHLGAARPFALEGVAAFRALEVSRAGGVIRVSNVSGRALTGCEWPDGMNAPPGATVLQPGDHVETTPALRGADPVISCSFPGAPVDFADAGSAVPTEGSTTIVYHLSTGRDR